MRIGELSSRTGASRRSLRYYEERGLLVSTRSDSGQRHYNEQQARHVGIIQLLFAAGLSSRVVAEMLPCMVAAPTAAAASGSTKIMVREKSRLDETIERLEAARVALVDLIAGSRAYQARMEQAAPDAVALTSVRP
jgi:DNA-binding transcriptional MerR regulator